MISNNVFPKGDAGAIRDESMARIYIQLGFKVVLLCRNNQIVEGEYDDIKYYSINRNAHSFLSKLFRYFTYAFRLRLFIAKITREMGSIFLVHLYDAPHNGIRYLWRYSINKGIKIVHDSVEWYSANQYRGNRFNKAYFLKNQLNTHLIKKPFRVICISSFLESHFAKKGLRTIRVPAILDVNKGHLVFERENDRINIVYAGSPANKDNLTEIIRAFVQFISIKEQNCFLHIIGIRKDRFLQKHHLTDEYAKILEKYCIFYGRIEHNEVTTIMKKMDFSILVRPETTRYSKAGFPTKVAEAMANSVAMICNLTSDLNQYLNHMNNSIIVEDDSTFSIIKSLELVSRLSSDIIIKIRKEARKTAEEFFDYRLYFNAVGDLLEG